MSGRNPGDPGILDTKCACPLYVYSPRWAANRAGVTRVCTRLGVTFRPERGENGRVDLAVRVACYAVVFENAPRSRETLTASSPFRGPFVENATRATLASTQKHVFFPSARRISPTVATSAHCVRPSVRLEGKGRLEKKLKIAKNGSRISRYGRYPSVQPRTDRPVSVARRRRFLWHSVHRAYRRNVNRNIRGVRRACTLNVRRRVFNCILIIMLLCLIVFFFLLSARSSISSYSLSIDAATEQLL